MEFGTLGRLFDDPRRRDNRRVADGLRGLRYGYAEVSGNPCATGTQSPARRRDHHIADAVAKARQPFTAPVRTPFVKYRWTNGYTISAGTTVTTTTAIFTARLGG